MRGYRWAGVLWISLGWVAAGCGGRSQDAKLANQPAAEPQKPAETVFMLAAASTQEPVQTIATNYERSGPSVAITCSFAGSSTVAQQIEAGAEADIFLSANEQWVQELVDKGLVADSVPLLRNRLVVIVPIGSQLAITKPEDLLKEEVHHVALADPDGVPAGIYARQALEKLNVWNGVQEKLAAGADVRQALAYVETGAAEAGIVYATDATISSKVKTAFPLALNLSDPVTYWLAFLKSAADKPAAEAFYKHLQSRQALEIFRQQGFGMVEDKGSGFKVHGSARGQTAEVGGHERNSDEP